MGLYTFENTDTHDTIEVQAASPALGQIEAAASLGAPLRKISRVYKSPAGVKFANTNRTGRSTTKKSTWRSADK